VASFLLLLIGWERDTEEQPNKGVEEARVRLRVIPKVLLKALRAVCQEYLAIDLLETGPVGRNGSSRTTLIRSRSQGEKHATVEQLLDAFFTRP
jgi:hypothetical protein